MYFTQDEVAQSLPADAVRRPKSFIGRNLRLAAAWLSDEPYAYKQFGPYWWSLKDMLKRHDSGSRAVWFRGCNMDEEIRCNSDLGSEVLNLHAAMHYADIQLPDQGWLDRGESELHICEWADGSVDLYRVSDADCGRQLDLFEEEEIRENRLKNYLKSLVEFLPRTWRAKGDTAARNGDLDLAVACYKRLILLAPDGMDRSEGWLLLGMTFDQKEHYNKAIFCYRNLYEREKQHWVLGNIAASYSKAGNLPEAFSYYEQALRQMPDNPEYRAGLERTRQCLAERNFSFDRASGFNYELIHA